LVCQSTGLATFLGREIECANFKQVVKDKPVRIHPIVSQLVDPAVLEKMKVRPVGEAGKTDEDMGS